MCVCVCVCTTNATRQKYIELVTLFRMKGLHRQALQLLVSLGQNLPQPPPRPAPTGKVLGPKETIKVRRPASRALLISFPHLRSSAVLEVVDSKGATVDS